MSTDRTVEIAESHGAEVTRRRFDDWASHQNWGLQNIDFKHDWVYYTDADERVTPELAAAIQDSVAHPGENVAYRVQRRDYFMGAWLKHVAPSPFNIRLFRPDRVRYDRAVNPVTMVDGPVGEIDAHFDHFPFSKGLSHWFSRHNDYSTFEAEHIELGASAREQYSLIKAVLAADANEHRIHQKGLYYQLPARPLVMFLFLYVWRRGFLDGRAGLSYAFLRSMYEYMIVVKARELRRAAVLRS